MQKNQENLKKYEEKNMEVTKNSQQKTTRYRSKYVEMSTQSLEVQGI